MKKNPLKSKTVNSALIIMLVAVMSLLGFGEAEIVSTFDGLGKNDQAQTETVKELATLLAAGGAIYGRYKVKEKDDE